MAKKKSMIPVAFIVTDDAPSRFETAYASTLFETYKMQEALSSNPKKTPAVYYFAHTLRLLNLSVPNNKIFAIYNPDLRRLTMAKLGDGDKTIIHIGSMAALNKLKQSYDAVTKYIELARATDYFIQANETAYKSTNLSSRISDKKLLKTMKDLNAGLPNLVQSLQHELGRKLIKDFGI